MFCNKQLFAVRYVLVALLCAWLVDARILSATSLVTCMDNSQISPTYFNVTFDPDSRSLTYSLDLTTEISGKVIAKVEVYAYGFLIIERDVDLCDLGWKQFCPVYPGNIQVESVEYISASVVNDIPGIAYTVPDIDAVVKVRIVDSTSSELYSCLQASFSNGKTVSQTGAKWATAIVAGLGLLIAATLSTFGNSNAASHISANAVSLFLYFQAVVVVSMQSVDRVPPLVSAWSENLSWSMGLIKVKFMQKIFRWYIQSTGGTPDLYFGGTTKQILVQRAYSYLDSLHQSSKWLNPLVTDGQEGSYSSFLPSAVALTIQTVKKRLLSFSLSSNANLIILRGIKRIGYNSGIEPTSIVATGFTFFILFGYVLIAIIFFVKQIITLLIRFKKIQPNFASNFRISFASIIKGSVLRYVYIGFTQLVILSLWEFTQNDSPAVIVLAVLFLLLAIGMMSYSLWRVWSFGQMSVQKFKNPAALLYGDEHILNKYGFIYTMFHAQKYWFAIVILGYGLIKGIFIGLCQYSGKASSVVVFVLDLAFTVTLIWQKPFLNKPTNIVNYCISIVNCFNSFFFMFFSDLFGQPAPVSSIMGWVFFILNAAFSLILLVLIIIFTTLSLLSKNPDARFAPAKDDRTSFQRKASVRKKDGAKVNTEQTNELFALGAAAQDHQNDWEFQMYKLNEFSSQADQSNPLSPSVEKDGKFATSTQEQDSSFDSLANEKERRQKEDAIAHENEREAGESFGTKLKKLTRGLSTKSKTKSPGASRISDTLSSDDLHFNDQHGNIDAAEDEYRDHANTLPIPKENSRTPINQHFRNPSNSAFSAYSTNPTDEPTNQRGFV